MRIIVSRGKAFSRKSRKNLPVHNSFPAVKKIKTEKYNKKNSTELKWCCTDAIPARESSWDGKEKPGKLENCFRLNFLSPTSSITALGSTLCRFETKASTKVKEEQKEILGETVAERSNF